MLRFLACYFANDFRFLAVVQLKIILWCLDSASKLI